jgi:hypothetical protein
MRRQDSHSIAAALAAATVADMQATVHSSDGVKEAGRVSAAAVVANTVAHSKKRD